MNKSRLNKSFIKAVKNNKIKLIKSLINKGADISFDDNFALRYSTKNNNLETIKILVNNGLSIHTCDDYILRWGTRLGYYDMTKFAVDNGAYLDACNAYAVVWSVYHCDENMLHLLLENGAKEHLDFIIHMCIFYGIENILKLFIKYGHINEKYRIKQCFKTTCRFERNNLFELLVENTEDSKYFSYALVKSCKYNRLENVNCLIEKGADIHYKNERPLKYAYRKNNMEIVKLLVMKGADYKKLRISDVDILKIFDEYDYYYYILKNRIENRFRIDVNNLLIDNSINNL